MRVRFSADAEKDLRNLKDYLEPRNPMAFQRMLGAIFSAAGLLERYPQLGHEGREGETRELSVPRTPFIIVYTQPDEFHIDVERVLHGRQQWPAKK